MEPGGGGGGGGGVVMSRTVWGCCHVKDCGHVKDCMGVWSCQGLYEGVVMSRADRMSMVSTWPWTVSSLCSKRTHSTIIYISL